MEHILNKLDEIYEEIKEIKSEVVGSMDGEFDEQYLYVQSKLKKLLSVTDEFFKSLGSINVLYVNAGEKYDVGDHILYKKVTERPLYDYDKIWTKLAEYGHPKSEFLKGKTVSEYLEFRKKSKK